MPIRVHSWFTVTPAFPFASSRSRGHSTFITELLIRNPERQARFVAASFSPLKGGQTARRSMLPQVPQTRRWPAVRTELSLKSPPQHTAVLHSCLVASRLYGANRPVPLFPVRACHGRRHGLCDLRNP